MNDVAARVSTPSMLMRVLGALYAILSVVGMTFSCLSPVMQVVSGALQAGTAPDQDAMMAALIAALFGSVFSIVIAIFQIVVGILGLAFGILVFVAGQRLAQLRSRGLVQAGAVLAAVQPIFFLFTSCCTSGCGVCGVFVWLPLAVGGVLAAFLVFGALSDADVDVAFAGNDAAPG